jgi:CheY-like chemotaxis protein
MVNHLACPDTGRPPIVSTSCDRRPPAFKRGTRSLSRLVLPTATAFLRPISFSERAGGLPRTPVRAVGPSPITGAKPPFGLCFPMTAAGPRISVLTINDDRVTGRLIREALARYPDLKVVGECGDSDDALRRTATLRPDVIVLDLDSPVFDGIQAVKSISGRQRARVLVFSATHDQQLIAQAFSAGAVGYLPKRSAVQLADAIRIVHQGRLFYAP